MDNVTWFQRQEPLSPLGVLIIEEQRVAVKKQLLNLEPNRLARLRGSVSEQALVILGAEADLPWLPGGVYLGQEANAPHLYIPTSLKPNIPIDWLDRAIKRKFGEGQFVINPWLHHVYNLSEALKLSIERLEQLM